MGICRLFHPATAEFIKLTRNTHQDGALLGHKLHLNNIKCEKKNVCTQTTVKLNPKPTAKRQLDYPQAHSHQTTHFQIIQSQQYISKKTRRCFEVIERENTAY